MPETTNKANVSIVYFLLHHQALTLDHFTINNVVTLHGILSTVQAFKQDFPKTTFCGHIARNLLLRMLIILSIPKSSKLVVS